MTQLAELETVEAPSPVDGLLNREAESTGRTASTSDSLLECLILIARAHGGALTRDAALAGLPVDAGGLTPSLFGRAARRAGLSSNIVQRPLGGLNGALLPAILLLEGDQACVLAGWGEDGSHAKIIFPELGEAVVELSVMELAARYSGRAIYVRPKFRFDARAPIVRPTRGQHWFWGVVAENRALYRDVLLAAFMINVFALTMPLFILNVYDRVVPNHAVETLWVLAIGVFIVHLGDLALRSMRGTFVDLAAARIDVKLSASIMERVLGMRMQDRPPAVGSFAANLRAFESVRDFISSATVLAFIDLPFAFLFIGVVAWIAWPMVPVFAVAIIALTLYTLVVQRRMHELSETAYRASAQRNATLVEGLVGIETVKAFGAEGRIQRRWEENAALLARVSAQLRALSASATNVALWVQHTVTVVVVIIGVYLLADNAMTPGGLIACYLLSSRAMSPIGRAAGLLTQYHKAATALTSLDKLMDRPVERPDDANFISRKTFVGTIEFRNVSFRYPNADSAALKEVSFRVKAGEHVALLGRVGSGKSSIQKLILGLYQPSGGEVLVDGIDLRQLDPAELRRNMGYVPQEVTLFYGSLRENITLAAPLADDAAVLQAARAAGLLDFVNNHPKGFDLPVGERGESLSGGQRHEVGIARAVIGDPPILLFDEPTASMDQASEAEVKANLKTFAKGKTMLVVTHRTSLLSLVDRIIVLDKGTVVADGPKAEVIEALRQGRIGRASR